MIQHLGMRAVGAIAALLLPLAVAAAMAQEPAPVGLANPLAAQPLERLKVTRERPLFSATRRAPAPPPAPATVAVAAPPPPPAPPPSVALLGIVSEPHGARAVVRESGDKVVRVRVGDDVGGWKVSKIAKRELVLSLGDRTASFALFDSERSVRPASRLVDRRSDKREPARDLRRRSRDNDDD